MEIVFEDTPVVTKTKELCQLILEQPNIRSIRARIDAFLGDETAKAQYEGVVNKGQELQQRQQMSEQLSQAEIDAFEKERDALLGNPVARGFIEAQEELHEVKHSIQDMISKTLELGRIPTEEDLQEGHGGHGGHGGGGCGSGGCGCSH